MTASCACCGGMHLPPRKREILRLIADGLTNQEIADQPHLAHPTVHEHVQILYRTIGAANRAHAVALGFRNGWIA